MDRIQTVPTCCIVAFYTLDDVDDRQNSSMTATIAIHRNHVHIDNSRRNCNDVHLSMLDIQPSYRCPAVVAVLIEIVASMAS